MVLLEDWNFLSLWLRIGTSAVGRGMLANRIDILSMHHLNTSTSELLFKGTCQVSLCRLLKDRVR